MEEKIITFGEIMLRLSTPDYSTINQTQSFLVNYGGGEANVAVALSHELVPFDIVYVFASVVVVQL